MSSFVDDGRKTPRPGATPSRLRLSGRIGAFVRAPFASLGSRPEEGDEPRALLARHEAVIAAARSAFGGTIAW